MGQRRGRSPWIPMAAVLGATGVGMAAYAAHGLGFIPDPAMREAARHTLHMAVHLQMWHALALLAIGVLAVLGIDNRWLRAAGSLMLVGVVLFAGLIYLRTLIGVDSVRALVPWGGVSAILGWAALGVGGYQAARRSEP